MGVYKIHCLRAEADSTYQTNVTCTVVNGHRPTYFTLHMTYDFLPEVTERALLLALDRQARASMWWGQIYMYVPNGPTLRLVSHLSLPQRMALSTFGERSTGILFDPDLLQRDRRLECQLCKSCILSVAMSIPGCALSAFVTNIEQYTSLRVLPCPIPIS